MCDIEILMCYIVRLQKKKRKIYKMSILRVHIILMDVFHTLFLTSETRVYIILKLYYALENTVCKFCLQMYVCMCICLKIRKNIHTCRYFHYLPQAYYKAKSNDSWLVHRSIIYLFIYSQPILSLKLLWRRQRLHRR